MKTLTLARLQALNACRDQQDAFAAICGDNPRVVITRELCASHAQVFDWYWASGKLLTPVQRKAYKGATALAQKAYDDATAPAFKAYGDARALAQKTYDATRARAQNAYTDARAPARKTYDDAIALA